MRLALPSLILFVYIMASLVWPLPFRFQAKAAAGIVLLAVSLKYLFYEKVFGSFIAPDMPSGLMLGMEMLYSALVILSFLLIIKDSAAMVLWLSRYLGASWCLPFSPGTRSAGLLALSLALSVWGTWQAVRVPEIRTIEIQLDHMDRRLDGFSIIQLSDLHVGLLLKKDWLEKVVKKSNDLAPDLVAVTGDMIDGYPATLKEDMTPLGRLSARFGVLVLGVSGNHEYYFGEIPSADRLGLFNLPCGNSQRHHPGTGNACSFFNLPEGMQGCENHILYCIQFVEPVYIDLKQSVCFCNKFHFPFFRLCQGDMCSCGGIGNPFSRFVFMHFIFEASYIYMPFSQIKKYFHVRCRDNMPFFEIGPFEYVRYDSCNIMQQHLAYCMFLRNGVQLFFFRIFHVFQGLIPLPSSDVVLIRAPKSLNFSEPSDARAPTIFSS